MHISFEGQALCSGRRTGVGWYTYNIINKLLLMDSENEYQINLFDFVKRNRSREKAFETIRENRLINLKECNYLPFGVYARMQGIFGHIPYHWIFGPSDISHFFNYFLPRSIKSKTINTVYDMVYKRYPETMSRVNYNILNKNLERSCCDADAIVTISENSKNEIIEYMNVPANKITITNCAVDLDFFYPCKDSFLIQQKYKIEKPYFLYLGTLEPRKNIPTIIKAFHTVSQKDKDILLVLAGGKGWMYNEIYKLVEQLNLTERVVFTGYVDQEDIPILYSCAQAFVFPSLYEGFGMPPLEAMACGTPVIVSNTSSLPEVVGDAGRFVNPYDVEHMAFEMENLLFDKELKEHYSQAGLKQARKFSWDDSAKKIIDLYKMLA